MNAGFSTVQGRANTFGKFKVKMIETTIICYIHTDPRALAPINESLGFSRRSEDFSVMTEGVSERKEGALGPLKTPRNSQCAMENVVAPPTIYLSLAI